MGVWRKLFSRREPASQSALSHSAPSPVAATGSTESAHELVVFPYGCPKCRTHSKLVVRGEWEFLESGVFSGGRQHQERSVRYMCPECRTTFRISQQDEWN